MRRADFLERGDLIQVTPFSERRDLACAYGEVESILDKGIYAIFPVHQLASNNRLRVGISVERVFLSWKDFNKIQAKPFIPFFRIITVNTVNTDPTLFSRNSKYAQWFSEVKKTLLRGRLNSAFDEFNGFAPRYKNKTIVRDIARDSKTLAVANIIRGM